MNCVVSILVVMFKLCPPLPKNTTRVKDNGLLVIVL